MDKLVNCLWYTGDAEEAAHFYAATFPDSEVIKVNRTPVDTPGNRAGDVITIEFTVCGRAFIGLNGPDMFKPNESASYMVMTEDQAETDRYWNAIVSNGGQESMCGWCKDRWGHSWQITPRVLMEATTSTDAAVVRRAFAAMLTMRKIDIAAIEAAVRGD
jgi:predicted 3-demethylubiquinone-9 3-methyltransferase (glyoxalase superfamily)